MVVSWTSFLTSNSCYIVENNNADTTVDASTIAIICWKGKSNLSIMVSASDAKELLERLEIRHGKKDITASVLEKSLLKDVSVAPVDDAVDVTEIMEEVGFKVL